MKKVSLFSAAMLALVFSAGSLYAGSVDALGNLSAEYVRSLSRNASTDTDAVSYNPAGVMHLEKRTLWKCRMPVSFKGLQHDGQQC